jgi:hypothetical protein
MKIRFVWGFCTGAQGAKIPQTAVSGPGSLVERLSAYQATAVPVGFHNITPPVGSVCSSPEEVAAAAGGVQMPWCTTAEL